MLMRPGRLRIGDSEVATDLSGQEIQTTDGMDMSPGDHGPARTEGEVRGEVSPSSSWATSSRRVASRP
jgi:hypothetical protein